MKLSKKKMVLMSFMLFSLFFGAGNLIFPPFLGQNAGEKMPFAIAASSLWQNLTVWISWPVR